MNKLRYICDISCHSDESQNHLKTILNQVQDDGKVIRSCHSDESQNHS